MIDISLNNVSKNYGIEELLIDVSFEVYQNEKICITGLNGCGKSTILKIIAKEIDDYKGKLSIRKNTKIGYLSQDTLLDNNEVLAKDVLLSGIKHIIDLKNKMNSLENNLNDNIDEYLILQDKFINLDGYELESKIEKTKKNFKIREELLNKKFNSLSGGERTIIKFASIILSEPDVLLLDEPTNHIDIDTLEWLEDYLKKYKGSVLFVSHDRMFISKIAEKIILIENGKADIYYGNYNYYLEEYKNRKDIKIKDYNNQQKEIKATKEKIKKLKEFGKLAGPTGGERAFRRAKSIQKRLDKIEVLDKVDTLNKLPVDFNNNKRSGDIVLNLKDINISYPNKVILNSSSLEIKYKNRVCLIGKNGCGKSSLIKYIMNSDLGSNVSIGYIPQDIIFDEDITLYQYALKHCHDETSLLRAKLHQFRFDQNSLFKRMNMLSGGEKIRIKLFILLQEKCNFLILDEPTNHIDINTRETLEEALIDFEGTILFVSHDRYFINKLTDTIVYFDNNKLYQVSGNYDDYLKIIKKIM